MLSIYEHWLLASSRRLLATDNGLTRPLVEVFVLLSTSAFPSLIRLYPSV